MVKYMEYPKECPCGSGEGYYDTGRGYMCYKCLKEQSKNYVTTNYVCTFPRCGCPPFHCLPQELASKREGSHL